VETRTGFHRRIPVVTWGTLLLMVTASLGTLEHIETAVQRWGLYPERALTEPSLDWITSFFLHADVYHLLSNAYFLAVFGDNVEEHLGRGRMLLLIVLSALVGELAHVLLDPRGDLPLIGASAGISGVIVLYGLLFPRARLTVLVLFVLPLTLPALGMLGIWAGLQFVGAAQQLVGMSAVSATAHLGGALVGVGFWLRERLGRRPRIAAMLAP